MLKISITTITLSALLAVPVAAQTPATTDDGRKVLLYDDGTWKPAPDAKADKGDEKGADILYDEKAREASIKARCAAQHGQDFFVRQGCENLQRQSVTELLKEKPEDIEQSDWDAIRNRCREQHAEDFFIRNGCQKLQLSSLRKLKEK